MSLHTLHITAIHPLKNVVLVRDIEQGDKVTRGGIIIIDDNGTNKGIRPRTCIVYKVGRDVDFVKPGDKILVSHARWTRGVNVDIDGDKFLMHMVDNKDILTIIDD
jgi:co-chaperonin GroES (HSP10)